MPSLPVIQPQPPNALFHGRRARIRSILLRLYRLAIVVAIVLIVQRQGLRIRRDGDAPLGIGEVKPFFPTASRFADDTSERMGQFVYDSTGQQVGYVLRTAPFTDHLIGYSGPTDTLVVLDRDMRIVGIRIRSSADTKQHVRDVAADEYFMKLWNGKTWDQVAGMDPRTTRPQIEGVSGASLTSLAIANGIHQRFRQVTDAIGSKTPEPRSIGLVGLVGTIADGIQTHLRRAQAKAATPPLRFRYDDLGLILVIGLACAFAFTRLRGRVWARRLFQVVLIAYVGFWNGQLLAQSLWSGWAASTVPWRLAPGLVLLAAAALVVPWTTRRALYCSQICPHGAAQELLGRVSRRKFKLHHGVESGLRWLPALLIALVLIVTIYRLPFELAGIEPFDAYLIRAAGIATITVALVGLIAALFVPMAYCKFGCPTGMVLSFLRSHGHADTFGRRDLAATAMVGLGAMLYATYPFVHHWIVR